MLAQDGACIGYQCKAEYELRTQCPVKHYHDVDLVTREGVLFEYLFASEKEL